MKGCRCMRPHSEFSCDIPWVPDGAVTIDSFFFFGLRSLVALHLSLLKPLEAFLARDEVVNLVLNLVDLLSSFGFEGAMLRHMFFFPCWLGVGTLSQ